MEKIIVRMPPSPTGPLHLGTARTALFNYLFAKKNKGEIIFRWEDTDLERSEEKFEKEILAGLRWLGMDFEKESSRIFRQTENKEFHTEMINKLWDTGNIFPCFLTPEEIEEMRTNAREKKQNFVFWSPFRELSREELEQKMNNGEKFVWRLKTPRNKEIVFQDLIRGEIKVNSETLGDFVIARNDGSVLYLGANVFDDYQQGVTHVLRGEDGLPNAPKQILIFKAIGIKVPQYGHIPLVLDILGKKLSKRNVDPNICVLIPDFQKAGFLPEAVVNGLAFLGWNPKTTEELFSLTELEKVFTLENVNSAPGKYDFEKMRFFNKKWLEKLPIESVRKYFEEWITNFSPFSKKFISETNFPAALGLIREKAKTFDEFLPELEYLSADPEIKKELLLNEKFCPEVSQVKNILGEVLKMLQKVDEKNFNRELLREVSIEKIKELGIKNGTFLHPFRIAISNRERSFSPFEIAEVLGKKETISRCERALGKLS
jgi:glutamyl-tRNA synthetase